MTTLNTGGAGFIGYHLAARLIEAGEDVIAIDNLNTYYSQQLKRDRVSDLQARFGDRFHFLEVDFAKHEALEAALAPHNFDRIAHLGGAARRALFNRESTRLC